LRRQAESGQVFSVALSETRSLMILDANKEAQIKQHKVRIKHKPDIQHSNARSRSALKSYPSAFEIKSSRNLTRNHLHLGDETELVFDLQEDRVEGQLVGLLI